MSLKGASNSANSVVAGAPGATTILAQSWVAVNTPVDTTEDTLATVTIPANTLRANDSMYITTLWTCTNNANVKTMRIRYSGIGGTIYRSVALTSAAALFDITLIANTNSTSAQTGGETASANGVYQIIGTLPPTSTENTTATTTLVFTGQKATAGDVLTLVGYIVQVMKA